MATLWLVLRKGQLFHDHQLFFIKYAVPWEKE